MKNYVYYFFGGKCVKQTIMILILLPSLVQHIEAQDYSITTIGGDLILTDIGGNSETLTISESGVNIQIQNSNTSRTYSLNGGAIMAFTTIPAVGISGLTSISVNTQGGNDKIIIDSFSTSLPNLTINGGLGDDTLNFKGNISLVSGANLDVDMQNDEINPGVDNVLFSTNAKISLVGLGTAIIKVSRNISFSANSSLLTEDGNITLEANQQTLPSNGNFSGIDVNGSVIQNTGNGLILIKGMGGNAGFKNTGVNVQNGGQIIGGQTGSVEVSGTGGISSEDANMGVRIYNTNSAITSIGGDVIVIGKGGGSGMSISNVGVML